MSDPVAFVLFGAALLAALGVGEALRAWAGWPPEASRRVVHVLVGLATALSVPLFAHPLWIAGLAALFGVVNVLASRRGAFPGIHGIDRPSAGTATFPLALLAALALAWTPDADRQRMLSAAFLVLGLADPAASLVGTRARRPLRYDIGGGAKTVQGSAAFFAVAVLAVWATAAVGAPAAARPERAAVWGAALVSASLATLAEAVGRRGWDNLWIVVAVLVGLVGLAEGQVTLASAALGTLAFGFVAAAHRARALDLGGAVAAGGLGWLAIAVGGWAWAVPLVVFFVLSSALSRFGRRRKAGAEALAEKGSRRDAAQVAANGGVAGALLLASVFGPSATEALHAAFLGALAAAAADTWATELGTWVGGPTRRLGVGRRVPPGTSGGVSVAGSIGSVAGAGTVIAAAWPFGGLTAGLAAGLVAAGVAGALADTALGATLQARYRLPSGALTERRDDGGEALPLAAGWAGVGNDAVNLACTAVGAGAAALAWAVLG